MLRRMEIEPPRDEHELRVRAHCLAGRTLDAIASEMGIDLAETGVHTKGKVGTLLERALGARGGSLARHDFPHLGIELKSIPIDQRGVPRESTFVCTVSISDADAAEWSTSWARAKLAHVLWIPILTPQRRVENPVLWRPTAHQEAALAADFDEIMGTIAVGGIEGLTARTGRFLQLRPKAQDGTPRAFAYGAEGERIATVPRGFYLRARFTGAILRDPTAMP